MDGKSDGLSKDGLPERGGSTLSEETPRVRVPLRGRGFGRTGSKLFPPDLYRGNSKKNVDPQPRPGDDTPMLP